MASNDLPCIGCDTQEGCGTGLGNFPVPGDPDNNVNLKATPQFGGVDVEWTYPATFPHAVQHTLLYKASGPDFNASQLLAVVSGNFFYDKNKQTDGAPAAQYYWIQLVSVHGTYGEVIGPAVATPRGTIADVIEALTGKIDAGVLAQSLKADIDRIALVEQHINQEITNRLRAEAALTAGLEEFKGDVSSIVAYVAQETKARIDGQQALVQQLNLLGVTVNNNVMAAIQEEETVRANADQALASQITTVQTALGDNLASVQQSMQTNIQTINGVLKNIGALYTAKVSVNGLVGGFGIYNDGSSVEAGFDVSTFWIGSTAANKRKPFIVSGGIVYIDEAAINTLNFNKLRSDDGSLVFQNGKLRAALIDVANLVVSNAQSSNYVSGRSGWRLSSDGSFEINGSGSSGRMNITHQRIEIYDNNRLRVKLGLW